MGTNLKRFRWSAILISWLAVAALVMFTSCRTPEIAGGPIRNGTLSDGVYRGNARYWPVRVAVDVSIEDQAITEIELIKHFRGWGKKAEGPTIERIIREQSTKVDAVTGATGSSIAIMNAVEDAIVKARQ